MPRDRLRRVGGRLFLRLHRLLARAGLLVVPDHYYANVPNPHRLEAHLEEWAHASALPGIEVDLDAQVERLETHCLPYREEYRGNPVYERGVDDHYGDGYDYVESQALYAFVRSAQPRRIVEVGSGLSTFLMDEAGTVNAEEGGRRPEITCVEPNPTDRLRELVDESAAVELRAERVQAVDRSLFTDLSADDFVFVDSTHTVAPGSDVNHLLLEVVPRLPDGVVIHFHDVFLPYDYARDTLQTFFHWSETSLLRALLVGNDDLSILFCLSHLHYERTGDLRRVFPDYRPQPDDRGLIHEYRDLFENPDDEHFPSATYLRVER